MGASQSVPNLFCTPTRNGTRLSRVAEPRPRSSKLLRLFLFAAFALAPSQAANFSFTGNFSMDDDLQYFTFDLRAASTVTIRSLGYAGSTFLPGGTNAAGNVIAPGGFDPILSLFGGLSANSPLLVSVNDAGCSVGNVGTDPATKDCWDSYIQWTNSDIITASYTLVLTQNDNSPGGLLGDPFSQAGNGNFTGPSFLGSPGAFWDSHPALRNSGWAVDILSADNASMGVPEPASLILVGGSCLALIAGRRLRRQ